MTGHHLEQYAAPSPRYEAGGRLGRIPPASSPPDSRPTSCSAPAGRAIAVVIALAVLFITSRLCDAFMGAVCLTPELLRSPSSSRLEEIDEAKLGGSGAMIRRK